MRGRIRLAVRRCVVVIEDNWRMTRDDARKAFLIALLAIPISLAVATFLGMVIITVIMVLAIVIAVLCLVSVVLAIVLVIIPPVVLIGLILAPLYYAVWMLRRRLTR
ncbi:MAG: hypothetical protein JSV77_05175 [Dehalococcoidales bacterium]|nr:MAG: hypothetical protein JSV77_05175 [Dehalococcoidales bacterium]